MKVQSRVKVQTLSMLIIQRKGIKRDKRASDRYSSESSRT